MLDNFGNNCFGCIYLIENIQNRKKYIGYTTKDIYKYITKHFKNALSNYDNNTKYLYNAIRKYGKQNFKWRILGYCYSKEELRESEIACIYHFRTFGVDGEHFDKIYGYNRTKGGDGAIGFKRSKETMQQIIDTRRKNDNFIWSDASRKKLSKSGRESYLNGDRTVWNVGLTKETDERLKHVSELNSCQIPWSKGLTKETDERLIRSEEHKKNLSISHKGHKDSQETKNKKSIAQKNRWVTYKYKKSKKTSYLDNNIDKIIELRKEGYSISEIAKLFNCSSDAIRKRIKKQLNEILDRYRYDLDEKINEIYNLKNNGLTVKELSIKFNCSTSAIKYRLKNFKTEKF